MNNIYLILFMQLLTNGALVNSLYNAAGLSIEKAAICYALEKLGLSISVRGEALTLEQFAMLAELI